MYKCLAPAQGNFKQDNFKILSARTTFKPSFYLKILKIKNLKNKMQYNFIRNQINGLIYINNFRLECECKITLPPENTAYFP